MSFCIQHIFISEIKDTSIVDDDKSRQLKKKKFPPEALPSKRPTVSRDISVRQKEDHIILKDLQKETNYNMRLSELRLLKLLVQTNHKVYSISDAFSTLSNQCTTLTHFISFNSLFIKKYECQ